MQITMQIERRVQDAGRERVLSPGAIVDLPEALASVLIATGAAAAYGRADRALDVYDVAAVSGAPMQAVRRPRSRGARRDA